ncbi:hypothetical protein [Xanthomonas albilineans]|uniref:hypothetical protein n=1 Tax=Xanthomonas albilineans TaxID=29447 RepID=UPI0005F34F8C|nr:hypothetical protein [Xanthomonas albilineans]QHQ29376.1 hypothetical protein XaFJ1_GM002663 [Xanthomonas albilineans]
MALSPPDHHATLSNTTAALGVQAARWVLDALALPALTAVPARLYLRAGRRAAFLPVPGVAV